MFRYVNEAKQISFCAESPYPVFNNANITLAKIDENSYCVRVKGEYGSFHLQRPMQMGVLNDKNINYSQFDNAENNPKSPSTRFKSLEHCTLYLDHYTGYSLVRDGNYSKTPDSDSNFINELEDSFSAIVSKISMLKPVNYSNIYVESEYFASSENNDISVFLPEYLDSCDKTHIVEIRTEFGVIELSKEDIESAIDISGYSYFFKEKGLLVTIEKSISI